MTLSPETQKLIEERMKRGGFPTPDDVVRAAIASLDAAEAPDLETVYPGFREKVAQGLSEADAGAVTDGDDFFADLEREEREREGRGQQGRRTA